MSSDSVLAVGITYSTHPSVKLGLTKLIVGISGVRTPDWRPKFVARALAELLLPSWALGATTALVCGATFGKSSAKALAKYSETHTVPSGLACTPAGLPPKVGTR